MALFQVYTALVTPFDSSGNIDFLTFESLVKKQISDALDGIVIFGTTGECCTLDSLEKLALLEKAVSLAKGKITIMANTGTNNTKESVELTKEAKDLQADQILAIVPYYNRPGPQGIISHFHAIADVGLPTVFYHHPGRCGVKLTIDTILEIAKHPMIVGVKECSYDLELIKQIKEKTKLKVYSGNDDTLSKDKQFGLDGVISVAAQAFPKPFQQASNYALEQLKPFIEAIFSESNPQGIKAALELMGFPSMHLRLPMTKVQLETKLKIKMAIEKYQHPLAGKLDLSAL